jgi:hypothetical protein
MAAGSTYTPIATTTLGSSATSYTFSSIAGTYTDLVLVASGTSTNAYNSTLQFNGDTGTNYSATVLSGSGSAASSYRNSSQTSMLIDYNGNFTSSNTSTIISILNYSNTTTYKTALSRANNAAGGVDAVVGLWRSTAAITSIKMAIGGGYSYATGTTFTLYGIAAA